jgi:hypothetical protein
MGSRDSKYSAGTRLAEANHTLRSRFESKCAEPNAQGCVNWLGTKTRFGHGKIRINSDRLVSQVFAHRVAWILKRGDIPPEILVLHRCDNPSCVNVDHLFLGSQLDNVTDMIGKNRHGWSYGKARPWQKLHSGDGERIDDLRRAGLTQQKIADWLGVSRPLISLILAGKIQHSLSRSHANYSDTAHDELHHQ